MHGKKLGDQAVNRRYIEACAKRCINSRQRVTIALPMLDKQLRQDWIAGKQAAGFHAHNEITNCSGRSTVTVDEWMNVVESPKRPCSKADRVKLVPLEVRPVDEIFHLRCDTPMRYWDVISHRDRAYAVLTCCWM